MEENLIRAVTNIENPTSYKRYKILYCKNVMVRIKLNHVVWTAYGFFLWKLYEWTSIITIQRSKPVLIPQMSVAP
jgi:hypothetical protein